MDTLAIIVNYNDAVNVIRCVKSIHGQARIVVWDNASIDDSVRALRHKFPEITVHQSPENVLWTPAINEAIETYLENEHHILVSNNDIEYRPDTVSLLSSALYADPKVGIVAPIGSGLGGMQDFASHHGASATRSWPQYAYSLPDLRVNYVVGASMMIPTWIWEKIGKFDNSMPLGADDHDYCIRVKHEGYKIVVRQSAYISHKSHASFKQAKEVWNEWAGKSWTAFNEKWAGYYLNKEEAVKCHWASEYHEGWDFGTGRMTEDERKEIWERRWELSNER